jgi:hypothetical protein
VQGERDVQVSVADARRLAAAAPRATLALLPTANHVLKSAPSLDRTAQLALYTDPTVPLAPEVVGVIAGWMEKRK